MASGPRKGIIRWTTLPFWVKFKGFFQNELRSDLGGPIPISRTQILFDTPKVLRLVGGHHFYTKEAPLVSPNLDIPIGGSQGETPEAEDAQAEDVEKFKTTLLL